MVFTPGELNGDVSLCNWTARELAKSFRAEQRVKRRCERALDIAFGPATPQDQQVKLVVPVKVAVDSHRRVIVTDVANSTIHIYDLRKKKHSQLRGGTDKHHRPAAVAVDGNDQIYVTEPDLGMVGVYAPSGHFRKYLGSVQGERFFERPVGLAIDRKAGHVYVSDMPRHLVYIMDLHGNVLARMGKRGGGGAPGEFRRPSDLAVNREHLIVLDEGNARIQVFDLHGNFQSEFPLGNSQTPLSLALDADSRVLLVNGGLDRLDVFETNGRPLYHFGEMGNEPGDFRRPTGACVDAEQNVYVVDSENQRLQVFALDGK
jgi:DNA-binding beta-propeller fold protein YncE